MRIKLDEKYYLNSDPFCYWISCEVKSEKTNKAYDKRVSGYCQTFEQAVESFINKAIRSSEADTLQHLFEEIAEIKKTVRKWGENEAVHGSNK